MLFQTVSRRLAQLALAVACSAFSSGLCMAEGASERLEEGIYAEETVGDLDAAIVAYEQAVQEGDEEAAAASEAQYRIGVCLQKQGKASEAAAAFEKVVQQYPGQSVWVSKAKKQLPTGPELIPAPWGNGDQLVQTLTLANGMDAGIQTYRISKRTIDADDALAATEAWKCQNLLLVTLNGQVGRSEVIVDAKTFAPVKSLWKHSLLGEARAEYNDLAVNILRAGKEKVTLPIKAAAYDNEQCAELFRRLPLADGYQTTLSVVSSLGGGQVPIEVTVTGIESISVPAGEFECFRLQLNVGQTFWISNDADRYLVQFEAGGLSGKLRDILPAESAAPTIIDTRSHRLELPVGWIAYTPSNKNDDRATTRLINSDINVIPSLEVGDLSSIQTEHATPNQWLMASLKRASEQLKDAVVEEMAVDLQINGQDASVLGFTHLVDGKRKRGQHMAIFGETSAANFRWQAPADQFEEMKVIMDELTQNLTIR